MSDVAPPPSPWRRRLRVSVFSSTALVIVAVASLLVMNELDRLIADVVSPSGRTHALSGVFGLGAALETEAWGDWTASAFPVEVFVRAHIVVDLLFIACYAVLLLRLIGRVTDVDTRTRRWGVGFVAAFAIADLLEDVLLFTMSLLGGGAGWLVWLQVGATYLKWLALLILLGYLFLSTTVGDRMRAAVGSGWRGVYAQRLVAIVVAAIAVVSLMSADGVIEQLPDVYRSWVGYEGLDWLAVLATLFAFAATGTGLLWLSRGRARRYAGSEVDERPASPLVPWFVTAGVAAVIGVILGIVQNRGLADWLPLIVFVVVLVAIPAVSFGIRKLREKYGTTAPEALRRADTSDDAIAARRAGDVLLIGWVVLAGLGPFKALVAPVALASTGAFDDSRFSDSMGWTVALALAFLALAIASAVLFRHWAAQDPPVPASGSTIGSTLGAAVQPGEVTEEQQTQLNRLGIVVLVISGVVVLAFLLAPMAISAVVGAAAVIVFLVGAWTGILGWLTLSLGRRRPLEIFQTLRLRSAPVITLLIVLPIVASTVQSAPGLHAVRFAAPGGLPDRPTLDVAFGDWYERDTCATTIAGVQVKPFVMVAAEGGGIRAATWTVDVLRELPEAGGCAADAVFASTGASGGSIGLAAFRTEGNAYSGADQTTIDFAADDALSADLAGLLGGDLVGSVSGIRVPSSGAPHTDAFRWHDRTALQELTWESQAPQFAEPFDADPVSPTGYLVLGSTDATSLCKVLVSQLDLSAGGWTQTDSGSGTQDAATPDCASRRAEFASTIDLVDYLGDCGTNLSWASAAELSARFPFVSPGGRIAPATLPEGCRDVADLQLVDGGSTDNSAIGTWVDTAPALTALIRQTNALADGGERPYVLPILLFATNEPGTDVLVAPDGTRPEALVPLAAIFSAKGPQTSPSAWLRRASDAYLQACPDDDSACTKAVTALRAALPGGVVVASPSTDPSISVPLGWSLSSFSRSRLRYEAEGQAICGRDPARVPQEDLDAHDGDPCKANGEYGMFGELLDHFDDASRAPVPTQLPAP